MSLIKLGKKTMSRLSKVIIIFVLVLCSGWLFFHRHNPSLCILSFRVTDADSGQPISPYKCGMPASSFSPDNKLELPKNMNLLINNNEGVFACVADSPVAIQITAEGYSDEKIWIEPANYLSSVSSKQFQEVKLKKVNTQ